MLKPSQRAIALPLLRDLVAGIGLACVLHGVWQVSHPAAWMLGGASLIGGAILWARAG